ncbi:MAG: porin family protein [Acidobacteria bacterium]|nr:porin family protein [Acidobacteriota bacterium]
MRKTILLALLLMLSAPLALAQQQQTQTDEPKKAEYFIGLTYENADSRLKAGDVVSINGIPVTGGLTPGGTLVTPNRNRTDSLGWNSSMTFYFTPRFGLTGDVSGVWRRENQTYLNEPYRAQLEIYNFLAGPQWRFVNSTRVTPYVRAMAGVAYSRNRFGARSAAAPLGQNFDDSNVNFALGLGGGVDYRISDRVSYRILQGDYNPIFRRDRTRTTSNGTVLDIDGRTEQNLRFSTGIVLH